MSHKLPKIIVIVGPTAAGKTELALRLAKVYDGEIVSADSRQMYKKMDIGTGKPAGVWKDNAYVVQGVPHYLMDTINPDEEMSVAHFKAQAVERLQDIIARGKTPFLVGGTGLYVWSVVDNLQIPEVTPNLALREELEKKSLDELVVDLYRQDPAAAKKVDLKNPRRVMRALEIALSPHEARPARGEQLFDALQIGITWSREVLNERIEKRIDEQFANGFVGETKKLLDLGFGFALPSMSGIGYAQIAAYMRGEMTLEEAKQKTKQATRQYARRQGTWFKRDKRIQWLVTGDVGEAEKLIRDFLGI